MNISLYQFHVPPAWFCFAQENGVRGSKKKDGTRFDWFFEVDEMIDLENWP